MNNTNKTKIETLLRRPQREYQPQDITEIWEYLESLKEKSADRKENKVG